MAIQTVAGAAICGERKHSSRFEATGPVKGNYAVSVCDRPKHSDGKHQDSVSGEEWRS